MRLFACLPIFGRWKISIHAPTWGATMGASKIDCQFPFQSTHPRGVRPGREAKYGDGLLFQSTHPRGVRLNTTIQLAIIKPFQSTHPRGVRHLTTQKVPRNGKISIHAPTWGATSPPPTGYRGRKISIHAPTWGATQPQLCCRVPVIFQSTHPRGVRLTGITDAYLIVDFNPRTHVGCD